MSIRRLIVALLATAGLLAFGAFRHAASVTRPPCEPASPTSTEAIDVCLDGAVADSPERTPYGQRWTTTLRAIHLDGAVFPACGAVQVYADSTTATPETGWHVRACGRLSRPATKRNPADFDLRAYLETRSIRAVLRARGPVAVLDSTQTAFQRALTGARGYVEASIERSVDDEASRALLASLLLGRRGELDPEIRSSFSDTGLSHLLAISGLHVLLVGMVLYGILRPTLLRLGMGWRSAEIVRSLITLGVLLGYAILCGGGPSVTRAVTMASVFLGGRLLQRPPQTLNSLGVAGLVLLAARPSALFEVGFQLSFAAVGGIVLLRPALPLLPERLSRFPPARSVADSCAVSLAATLSTGPVLAAHFGRVALAGVLLNVVAIPLTATVLTAGLLILSAGWVHPSIGGAFGATAEIAARALFLVATQGADTFSGAAVTGFLNAKLVTGAIVLALLGVAFARRPVRRWWPWIAAQLLLGAHLWIGVASGRYRSVLEVAVLDVRHGDATLVHFPEGRTMLVDAGSASRFLDHGERTIARHLDYRGVRQIDALLLTHPHGDHIGGAGHLLRNGRVRRLLLARASYRHPAYADLSKTADSAGVPIGLVTAGDTLRLDPFTTVEVLWPPSELAEDLDLNDHSVVLRIAFGRHVWLFMGDAERETESVLCRRFGSALRSTVVKVGHHGSRTSSAACLVHHSAPPWALVSVGAPSGYGLPDEEVIHRWQAGGAHVAQTHEQGALSTRSDGDRLEFSPLRAEAVDP